MEPCETETDKNKARFLAYWGSGASASRKWELGGAGAGAEPGAGRRLEGPPPPRTRRGRPGFRAWMNWPRRGGEENGGRLCLVLLALMNN